MSLSIQADAGLLDRLRKRDPEVLAATVHEHSRPPYRAARGMGLREEEAEDLVQEVFATFLESLDRFEGRSQLRTWLFGILHNKFREGRREAYREEQNDPIEEVFESRFDTHGRWIRPPEDILHALESKELGRAIQQCMDGLPAAQREVFVLREMQELETPEICNALDLTVTNVNVLMHRARNRLRECIESKGWSRKR